MKNIKTYAFDAPLLITEHELIELDSEYWKSGSALVKYLADSNSFKQPIGELKGIVIPLELKLDADMARQDAHGVELLTWLRWSASEPLRYVPVLVTAFQPLESVLRRKLNLLLVARGTQFFRLPDSLGRDRLVAFKEAVRGAQYPELCANAYDLNRLAGTASGTPPGVTYHDLANHYYAAHRLWEGYKAAVGELTGILKKDELTRVKKIENGFSWKKDKDELLSRPDVRQYLALAKQGFGVPQNPDVTYAKGTIKEHVINGLRPKTRILLVDNEFDKGLADVLLGILFKDGKFIKNEKAGEWVCSDKINPDKPWACLVCVKSADLAVHWLTYWGDINKFDDGYRGIIWPFDTDEQAWLRTWQERNSTVVSQKRLKPEDVLCNIDIPTQESINKSKDAVVLLDLRLEPHEQKGAYDPAMLKSVRLRRLIKLKSNPAPVIMMTASRQTKNYSLVMENATDADGWLMKEGPDIIEDDKESARSVHYLLQRIHQSAARAEWYRPEMNWGKEPLRLVDKFRAKPNWIELLKEIQFNATKCFEEAIKNLNEESYKNTSPPEWMDKYYSSYAKNTPERFLARRLFAFGMFLYIGEIKNNILKTDKAQFHAKMPGSKKRKDTPPIASVFNFENICLSGYTDLHDKRLLEEEYDWLLKQFADFRNKKEYLARIISQLTKNPKYE